eukprot:3871437-Prymnesium_polylepis.1
MARGAPAMEKARPAGSAISAVASAPSRFGVIVGWSASCERPVTRRPVMSDVASLHTTGTTARDCP